MEHSKYLFRFSQTLDFYFTCPLVFKNKVDDFLSVTLLNLNFKCNLIYLRVILGPREHRAFKISFQVFSDF
jgi:hypothetical protein